MKTESEKQIIKSLEGSGVVEYVRYLQSPWKIFWSNLLAGIARGFGIILGMTVVLGISLWVLAQMVNVPLIGEYFQTAQEHIVEYTESTNYSEEFSAMQRTLEDIRNALVR